MKEFVNKVKEFFSWVGEKTWRVLVAVLVFVFIILPAIFILIVYFFFGSRTPGLPMTNDGSISFYERSGGVSGKMMTFDAVSNSVPASAEFYVSQKIGSYANSTVEKKVIKNGSLNLIVKNTENALVKVESIVRQFDGFLENVNIYEISDGNKTGSVTVRVPAKNFSDVMSALKALAVKVSNESVSSNDVTAQYVDLEAEIKNYKAEEVQYQKIMEKATKIEDVLNVAGRLAEVRGKIDRAQAQLNYLSRQVDMSTINVSFTGEADVKVFGIVWRPLTVLKQSIKSMFTEFVGFIDWLIMFVFRLPILIIKLAFWALVIFFVVNIFKKVLRYFSK